MGVARGHREAGPVMLDYAARAGAFFGRDLKRSVARDRQPKLFFLKYYPLMSEDLPLKDQLIA